MSHPRFFASAALIAGAAALLPAQGIQAPAAATAAATTFAPPPTGSVRVERPRADEDTVWLRGDSYKASVARDAVTFIPFLGAAAPRNQPLELALEAVRCGGRELDLAADGIGIDGTRVTVQRRDLAEVYDAAAGSLEQSFRFDRLDGVRGDLEIILRASGEAVPATVENDVVFRGPLGDVRYEKLVAVDAAGARLALPIAVVDGRIRLVVPADFVARAALPLVVDPVLAGPVNVWSTIDQRMTPDVAWNPQVDEHLVVWRVPYSATDWDVAAVRTDFWMNPIGTTFWIDFTSAHWETARIASKRREGMFLVVGQTSQGTVAPFSITGRRYEAIGTTRALHPMFDIQRATVAGHLAGDAFRPDVSGDPWYLSGPAFFTVVWEHHLPGGNGDIVFRQLNADGSFVTASPVTLNGGPYDDYAPAISKSSGDGVYGVVWTQYNGLSGPGGDIVAAAVTYDGLTSVSPFFLDATSNNDSRPRISTPSHYGAPTSNALTFLVTWERNQDPFSNYGRLHCAAIGTGPQTVINRWDLTALLGIPSSTWCYEPVVDCDGTRFAVVHGEVAAAAPGQGRNDLYVSTLALDGTNLLVHESRTPLQNTGPHAFSPSITSRYGASLDNTRTYSIVGGTSAISTVGWIYNGHQPGTMWSPRPGGCGSLTLNYSGYPLFGDSLTLDVAGGSSPFHGILLGFPMPATPIAACPSCTLGVTGGGTVPAPYHWSVPYIPGLVGVTLSAQGYGLGAGPCLGAIEVTNPVDFTLR